VAADLFYRESIRSVGVETIVQKAGVAKISLYRSFASKDDLIVAYLNDRNETYWRAIDRLLAKQEGEPRAAAAARRLHRGADDHARISGLPVHQLRRRISRQIPSGASDRRCQ